MADVDGISGFGSTVTGSVTGAIGQLSRINIPGIAAAEIDITTMAAANGFRRLIAGLKDARTIDLDLVYAPDLAETIMGAIGDAAETWTVTLPDGATFVCDGFIQSVGMAIPMDDKISQTVTIRLTGAVAFTAQSA